MAALLHFFANGVVELRWEWTSANAGRVALDDAQHLIDMLWTNTSAYTGSAGVWIGRGDEWIRPVVDIQKRSLRTFEADLLASFQRLVQQIGRIADLILDLLRQRQIFVSDGIRVERFYAVELRQQIVFQRHSVCQTCAEIVRIHHIAHAQARARAFIHVARADAVFRGADLGVAFAISSHSSCLM